MKYLILPHAISLHLHQLAIALTRMINSNTPHGTCTCTRLRQQQVTLCFQYITLKFEITSVYNSGTFIPSLPCTCSVPPRFTQPPTNSTAIEGAQHILTCAATGDPTPLVAWSSSDGMVVSSQGTLLFSSVARDDSGLYTCTASSSAGSVEVEIYLDIQCKHLIRPPRIKCLFELTRPTVKFKASNS